MNIISHEFLTGERALFMARDMTINDSVFDAGESPLKESKNIVMNQCLLRWKYPFWYANNITCNNCTWFEMARAGVWYTTNMVVNHSVIQAPKNFRKCQNLTLTDVIFTNAAETLWNCTDVTLNKVVAKGDYFAMGCTNMNIADFTLDGNYSFDGAKNITIHNATMLSKDAFWNTDNVTVYDSFITGEYLGWNAKNLTLINCTIESLQGFCYIENLKLINCKLINTTLAFEYSTIQAEINSKIDSILNPTSGTISAPEIGELIIEADKVDPNATQIICDHIGKRSDHPTY